MSGSTLSEVVRTSSFDVDDVGGVIMGATEVVGWRFDSAGGVGSVEGVEGN